MSGQKISLAQLCHDKWDEIAKLLLETPHWPEGLEINMRYRRFDDDTHRGAIVVVFSQDGDAWFEIIAEEDPDDPFGHRFRVPMIGGGESERVRQALLLLALAIKLDNETKPQKRT